MPTYRRNTRNELIQLRALLKLAYGALRKQGCIIPKELLIWNEAQRKIVIEEKRSSEITVDLVHKELVLEGIDGDDI